MTKIKNYFQIDSQLLKYISLLISLLWLFLFLRCFLFLISLLYNCRFEKIFYFLCHYKTLEIFRSLASRTNDIISYVSNYQTYSKQCQSHFLPQIFGAHSRDDEFCRLKNYSSKTCCGLMRLIVRRVLDSTRTAAINETLVTENSRAAAFFTTNGIVIPIRSEGS